MRATLTIAPIAGYRADDKLLTIDCEHGTTTVHTLAGATPIPDDMAVRLALAKHWAEQPGCRRIRHLERRYGRVPA